MIIHQKTDQVWDRRSQLHNKIPLQICHEFLNIVYILFWAFLQIENFNLRFSKGETSVYEKREEIEKDEKKVNFKLLIWFDL